MIAYFEIIISVLLFAVLITMALVDIGDNDDE